MSDQNKVIIDENLQNTFGVLNDDPSLFRVKDYAGNLPDDYADDFAYALFESCLTVNAKYTLTHLVLKECRNEEAGTEIENKRFNELYQAAKDANPSCRNGYLPMFFAYIQLVAEEPGITEAENKVIVSKLLNIIEQDKNRSFPEKLYRQDEYANSIGLEMPIPSQSFLNGLKEFYENLMSNPVSNTMFDRHAIDSTLNQYIDDIYSLTYTDEEKSLSWFERTDKILTIEQKDSMDRTKEILENTADVKFADLYKKIVRGFVEYPLYKDGQYDFSYFSTSANLLANNLTSLIMVYNASSKDQIKLPEMDLPYDKKQECLESYNTFIASYITALISEKYKLENPANDPDRLLDPNLKVNLLKANENIFATALSEGKSEQEIAANVKKLIAIAKKLMKFAENEQFVEEENVFEEPQAQQEQQPVNYDISSNEVFKHMLTYLKRQQKVYIETIKKLQVIKGHLENNYHYKKDQTMLKGYAALYAPNMDSRDIDIDKLIDVIDRKSDKLYVAISTLKSRTVINNFASYLEVYNTPNTPEVIRSQELQHMDAYIRKVLKNKNCDEDTIQTCIGFIHDTMKAMPEIKQTMSDKLADKKFTLLKANEPLKKAIAFSSVIADVMYFHREFSHSTYRFIENLMPKKSLRLDQKYIVKDYVRDAILNLSANLNRDRYVRKDVIADLCDLAERFDETTADSFIKNGLMSKESKAEAIKKLHTIYEQLPNGVKEDKNHASCINLVDLIPDLIKKIPTTKEAATTNFIEFVCEFVEESQKDQVAAELAVDLKKAVKDEEIDPYDLKNKYLKYVPDEQKSVYEDLWKTLPRVTPRTRDKAIFESAVRQLTAGLTKDQRTKYLAYLSKLFSRGVNRFVARNQEEKEMIDKLLLNFKESFVELLENARGQNADLDIDELLNILNKYAVTNVDVEDGENGDDENN